MRFIRVTYRSRNESNSSYHQSPPLRWATACRTWKHGAHCTASRHSADWLWSFPGGWVGLTSSKQLAPLVFASSRRFIWSLVLLSCLAAPYFYKAAWLVWGVLYTLEEGGAYWVCQFQEILKVAETVLSCLLPILTEPRCKMEYLTSSKNMLCYPQRPCCFSFPLILMS